METASPADESASVPEVVEAIDLDEQHEYCEACLAADILILHQDMGRSFLTIEEGGENSPRACYDRIVAWANRFFDQ